MTTEIILDVDTGIDDALAIMFALRHPELEIKAISCVDGNVPVERVVENTLKVLDLLDAGDIPVAAGATRPLIEPARAADGFHGVDGLGDLGLPASARRPAPGHAVELMYSALSASPRPLTIVELAPMTNLALLLRLHPDAAERIERIVFMGGSASAGNATAVAEFNIWHDPEAARIVMESGVPLTMYGLDVFDLVAIDAQTTDRLAASSDRVASVVGALLGHRPLLPDGGLGEADRLIGDAGAVCALVAPELVEVEALPTRVVLVEGESRGQTQVDRRRYPGEDAVHGLMRERPIVDVVLRADLEGLARLFLTTVAGPHA